MSAGFGPPPAEGAVKYPPWSRRSGTRRRAGRRTITPAELHARGAKHISSGGHHKLWCDGTDHWIEEIDLGGEIRRDMACTCKKPSG